MNDDQTAATEAARKLAGRRKRVQGICQACGTPFEGTTRKKWCSPACAVRGWREKRKDGHHPGDSPKSPSADS